VGLEKEGSRFRCLPLPSKRLFLGFFCEGTDYADVPVVDDDLLPRGSGISLITFTDFNPLDKQIQKFAGQFVNLGVTF
jgi:hypothetical protein